MEINGKTLLETTVSKLKSHGFNEIIVNVHHFADKIIDFLKLNNNFGINIAISDERDLLLDTGGGLKKASWFFDDNKPFLVYNVDILSDIDLNKLYQAHVGSNVLATLAVRERKGSRYFLFDKNHILCGWKNTATGETIILKNKEKDLTPLGFSGIHVVSPEILSMITEQGVFSIKDVYLRLAKKHNIKAYKHDGFWMDLGKKENLTEAEKYYK